MNVLVTGGAGYIGSHMVHFLISKNYQVIVLDNLSTGHEKLIHPKSIFIKGDICDRTLVETILLKYKIEAVIHFAAFIKVDESVTHPYKYYHNNTYGSLQLFQACNEVGVQRVLFSSTAAVYGDGSDIPLEETNITSPKNPYGQSKLMSEKILHDISTLGKIHYAILRYFNVAGANNDAQLGQISNNSTHLIKVAAETAAGKRASITIHGTDYSTKDGTCIRDYIHIQDLINAHFRALYYLSSGGQSEVFNLGYGTGVSVKEVVKCMKNVSKVNFKVIEGPRRMGDGSSLVANSAKARKILNWEPNYDQLEKICSSAYEWERHLDIQR